MNILLIFFALPISTIIISIVIEKILKSPILVAAFAFAIYLIVTFSAFDLIFLVATIIYTILAYLAAFVFKLVCEHIESNNKKPEINCNKCCNCCIRNMNCTCRR